MLAKRLLTLSLTVALSLTTLTCRDASSPVSPVDSQYAKGGKPGKPTQPEAVELLEYYVFQDDAGLNYVHILARGDFPLVNLNVVQDYIFIGIRDDDYSIFYEYTTSAPLPVGEADLASGGGLWEFDEETEAWHVDIPWNGETWWRDYSDPENPVNVDVFFPDFPHAGLGSSGTADPYAFDIRFQKENGDFIDGFQPQGIILDGAPVGEAVWNTTHGEFHGDVATITSYATFASSRTGLPVFIDHMSLDEGSVTCQVKTIREGTGKTRTTREVTEVTGTARVVLSTGEGDPVPDAWIDVMFATPTNDPNMPELADSFVSTHGAGSWADGWGVSAQFDGARSSLWVQLAVDYVYATDLEVGTVYVPHLNNPRNEGGWSTINAGPISELRVFPIALTEQVELSCAR